MKNTFFNLQNDILDSFGRHQSNENGGIHQTRKQSMQNQRPPHSGISDIEKKNRLITKNTKAMEKIFKSSLSESFVQNANNYSKYPAEGTPSTTIRNKDTSLPSISNLQQLERKKKTVTISKDIEQHLISDKIKTGPKFESKPLQKEEVSNSQIQEKKGSAINANDKQNRIDGQIKKYMHKIGLEKKEKFPVFYRFDENGKEVKTTFSNHPHFAKLANQQQKNQEKVQFQVKKVKNKQDLQFEEEEEKRISSQAENLEDIMKICGELHKSVSKFDRKNSINFRNSGKDFRKLNNQMKELELQNVVLLEQEDPSIHPYLEQLKMNGYLKHPSKKQLLENY